MTNLLEFMGVPQEERFTELQKKDFDTIITTIRKDLAEENFHITQEFFSNGYLIRDDHKIWIFYVKECPDWRFGVWIDNWGIWASKRQNTTDEDYYQIQTFAQHENYIDKFKPSVSTLLVKEQLYKGDVNKYNQDFHWAQEERKRMFRYIRDFPALAWYQDTHYTDLKFEYVSLEKAQKEFEESEKERLASEDDYEQQKKEEYDFVASILKKKYKRYKILYDSNSFPCYTVIIEDEKLRQWNDFLTDEEEKQLKKIRSKHNKYNGACFMNNALYVKSINEVEDENN
ncbi:MAG: hypothetical protein IJ122_06205 [Methanobrevibacter sp.]|nr:hypothetical protein [Methanobrevibacter sp.]